MSTKNTDLKTEKKSKKLSASAAKAQEKKSSKNFFEKLKEAQKLDKEKYINEKFKNCHPKAKEISDAIATTIWEDSMKIMQDYPSTYAQTAAVCFFSFLCAAIDAHLEMSFSKDIPEKELPKVEPAPATSEMVKMLLKRAETECNAEGQLLLKNLLERDFGYLMAVLKALNIENAALHNLLVSNFRFWMWDVMIPHLFLSEHKKEEAHA